MDYLRPKQQNEVDHLLSFLNTLDFDELRKVVFFLYRGNPHDSTLFALMDVLNDGPLTINKIAAIKKWIIKLTDEIKKGKKVKNG